MPKHEFDKSESNIVGILRSGEVVIDRPNSHNHLAGEFLREALGLVNSDDRDHLVETVDMGRVIGVSRCVQTTVRDTIVYAHRLGRNGPTRFVLGREPEPTTNATVVLKRDRTLLGTMILITARAGAHSEAEPWDPHHTEESKEVSRRFWASHALVPVAEPGDEIDFSRPGGIVGQISADYLEDCGFLL